MISKIKWFVIISAFFSSCEIEEIPIDIVRLINYTQVDIGADYCYQKYYDIDTDTIVGENLITDWDLAFSNSFEYSSIILNSSKYMRIVPFNPQTIFSIDDLIKNANWQYDNPNGDLELTAFNNGGELSNGYYLVDRGYDCDGNLLGQFIFRIVDYNENTYSVQIIDILDDSSWLYNDDIIEIQKTDTHNVTYFSLDNSSIVNIADFEWDLCFSQYTEFNVPQPNNESTLLSTYCLVGVLQNLNLLVAVDTINNFEDITIDNISNYVFSTNRNTIGYDWKWYDFDLGIYSIDSPVYIIKTESLAYFKMLFIDFYNENGEEGAPTFQLQEI